MAPTSKDATSPARDLTVVNNWWRAANYLSVGQNYLLDNSS